MNLPEKFCEKMKALLGSEYDAFIKAFDSSDTRGILILKQNPAQNRRS